MLFSSAFRFVIDCIRLIKPKHIGKLRVTYETIQVFSLRYRVFTLFTLFLNLIYTFLVKIMSSTNPYRFNFLDLPIQEVISALQTKPTFSRRGFSTLEGKEVISPG